VRQGTAGLTAHHFIPSTANETLVRVPVRKARNDFRPLPKPYDTPTVTHERLDVYHVAIEHLVLTDEIANELPKGGSYLADQLRRAALSIPNNIAEGAGEFALADKARFYRMARRSGTECAALLHACRVLGLANPH